MRIIRVLGLAVLGLWALPTLAQPGSTGGRPPGGGGMRGAMRSPKMRLPRLVEGAAGLSGANALTKAQAKKMVGLVTPWKSRPTMSEDAGKALFTSLTNTLTAAQKTALQNDRPRFGGPGGPGGRPEGGRGEGGPGGRPEGGRGEGGRGGGRGGFGGGPGGPGGGEPPSKAQMDKMRSMMASYNPLYTGTPAGMASVPEPMKERMERRRDQLKKALSQLQQKAR